MAFDFLLLPREIREAVYYQYLLDCIRQFSYMTVGYNQWLTPELLPTSGSSDQERLKVASKYTDPLEVEIYILAPLHNPPPYRPSYGWRPETLTILMCVSRFVRDEAEVVLYRRFIFCFHHRLYPKTALRFLSNMRATALSSIRAVAFVLRFESPRSEKWTRWRANHEVLSQHLKDVRSVIFEIQAPTRVTTCRQHEAGVCPTKLKEKNDTIRKLLEVAEPFTTQSGVQVRWVGVGVSSTLAELCRVELAKVGHCPMSQKTPHARDYYLMAFDS